ncbi:MAG: hypothetical protein B6D40_05140 [Anaerolineae bacterium UTCFX3]|nr:MAG: hypothetical protein B6D40_05140 [Anaerolineae bacterium UTCFX3]
MTRCSAQNTAQINSSASPAWTAKRPPVERRYAPPTAIPTATTASQWRRSRHPKNNISGTKTTYSAVMKPALPAVVYTTPACCSALPMKRRKPAMSIHLNCAREIADAGGESPRRASRKERIANGSTASAARR